MEEERLTPRYRDEQQLVAAVPVSEKIQTFCCLKNFYIRFSIMFLNLTIRKYMSKSKSAPAPQPKPPVKK